MGTDQILTGFSSRIRKDIVTHYNQLARHPVLQGTMKTDVNDIEQVKESIGNALSYGLVHGQMTLLKELYNLTEEEIKNGA